jgi:flagellar biosynthetic protein FlhB
MAQESFQEKTEKATPKKREKARREGQVAKSAEIPSVFILLVGVGILYFSGQFAYEQLVSAMRANLRIEVLSDFTIDACVALLADVLWYFFLAVIPIMGGVFLTAIASNVLQVGFHWSPKAIQPKLHKLSFFKGITRLFSAKSFIELTKAFVKIAIIGVVSFWVIKSEIPQMLTLYDTSASFILVYILTVSFKIFIWVTVVMVVVAILDYAYQKWQFEKELRMTKQEVKEESKQAEGDPQIKSRIRSIQMQAARRRMMQDIPEADVVITNPTHLALAIKYEPGSMGAPKVIAKGAGKVAERIRKMARDYQIPVIENKKLARNLYKLVGVGEEIPSEFYQAVAELLAYVYRLKRKSNG